MKRNWTHGLMWIAAGMCCFATIAEADAGIIFRQRPGIRRSRVTYQPTYTRTVAPAAAVTTTGANESTVVSATPTTTAYTTTATRSRRRGILGRRRGTMTTSSQVTANTSGGMTVRGQTPDSLAPAYNTTPAPVVPGQNTAP